MNGVDVGLTGFINLIEGDGVGFTVVEDIATDYTTVTIATTGEALAFTRGGTLYSSSGISSAANLVAWRAPFGCTLTALYGYRVSGTGATVNARRNGADNHLASALSITSTDTWTDGGTVQNTAYVAGDTLELMVVSVTGLPTSLAWQLEYVRT